MSTRLEAAVADEILAEAARKHLTHRQIQQAAGIEERAWRRYFVEQSRTIPVPVLMAVGDALGTPAEDLIARARVEVGKRVDHEALAEDALSQLSDDSQARIRKVAEDLRPKRDDGQRKRKPSAG